MILRSYDVPCVFPLRSQVWYHIKASLVAIRIPKKNRKCQQILDKFSDCKFLIGCQSVHFPLSSYKNKPLVGRKKKFFFIAKTSLIGRFYATCTTTIFTRLIVWLLLKINQKLVLKCFWFKRLVSGRASCHLQLIF